MRLHTPIALPFLTAALLSWAVPGSAAPAHPRVKVDTGTIEGRIEDGVRTFKGIPYAAPPVGDLRWKAPQPAAPWKTVRQADGFGPRCMQLPLYSDMVFRSNGMGEDCLYLNVWAPAAAAGAKLPVLVYFYGGGLQTGDGSEPRYDGASMAKRGIVALTVNYRLGAFGFFAHPALTAESPDKASGNYGMMDQAAALAWVRRNIASFGGDPARVTIAGESAGSYSVSVQMASPLARNLIAGAIGESGAVMGLTAPPTLAEAEAHGQELATQLGASTLEQLRAVPANTLLETAGRKEAPRFGVIVDGHVLPQAPSDIFAAGQQAKVPLMAGWNSEEGSAKAILGDGPATEETFAAALQRIYGERAAAARQAYSGDIDTAARELASDRFIGFGTWRWIDLAARTGGKPVYRYYYTHPRPATRAGAPADTGAHHSVEIEYALGNLDGNPVYAWTADDREVGRQLQAYFTNFIKTGNPNGRDASGARLPQWPALDARGAANGTPVMVLDVKPHAQDATDAAHHAFHLDVIKR